MPLSYEHRHDPRHAAAYEDSLSRTIITYIMRAIVCRFHMRIRVIPSSALYGEKQNTTYVIVALFLLWASDCGEVPAVK
jgi:hypothetical protein